MTNREMFLLATSILFASTTAGLVLQGTLHKGPHHKPGFERHWSGKDKRGPRPDFFALIDADKNGFITKEEMTAHHTAKLNDMFATADTDKDGRLTREEMKNGRDLMRAKFKERFKADRAAADKPAE